MTALFRSRTAALLAIVFSYVTVMTGCPYQTTVLAAAQDAAPAPVAPVVAPVGQMSVDDLVAPIALYPDQLLAQVLSASTNTQEVLDGGNWLIQHQSLKGDALTNAAKAANFSPSMQYLMAFPQVVDNMCQEIDWTTQLGQAFKADQNSVMDAVQRKRAEAQQAGNLKTSPEMVVATQKADNGQQYVEIKPANPQVVYVPQYNPVTIYAPAPTTVVVVAHAATPTTQVSSGVSTGSAVAIGLLSFGVGVAIGSAMHQDNYYPYPAWGYRSVYYVGRPYYPPMYRPVYPGYRPAYGYHPPPNYHWHQYNKNVNITVNNTNYYGKYNKTTVNNRNTNVNNVNRNTNVNNVNRSGGNQSNNWKGQSTYQGARPNTTGQKPGASMTKANPQTQQMASRPSTSSKTTTSNRSGSGSGTASPNASRPPNANAGTMNKAAPRSATTTPPTARPTSQQGTKTHNTSKGSNASNKTANAKPKVSAVGRGQAGSDSKQAPK